MIQDKIFEAIIYCKSFEVEKFHGFCESIVKRKTFTVKHFCLVLKMVVHGPGSSLKQFCDLLSTLEKVSGIMLPSQNYLIHSSNVPDNINIAIHWFPNDVQPTILINMLPNYLRIQLCISNSSTITLSKAFSW